MTVTSFLCVSDSCEERGKADLDTSLEEDGASNSTEPWKHNLE